MQASDKRLPPASDDDQANVREGSKAALTAAKSDFRYTPESGLNSDITPCPKSANSGQR